MARARGQSIDEVAFGFGDVTLAGLIGLIVGWPAVVLALLIGILAAGVFSLGHVLVSAAAPELLGLHAHPLRTLPYPGRSLVYFGGRALFQSICCLSGERMFPGRIRAVAPGDSCPAGPSGTTGTGTRRLL